MGCLNAKVDNDPRVGNGKAGGPNGTATTKTFSAGDPGGGGGGEAVDPRSPLDGRQIFKLKQSWKGIKRHMEDTGVEMFLRLFKSNSELKNMFHEFKDLTSEDDLRANEALENHATLVMTTLDDAITHIDNYDYVSEVLRKTGASHVRFEGFKSDNFLNIRDPFLEAVKITLGDRYTDNMESIYKVAITFILQTMVEGMEDALKNKAT